MDILSDSFDFDRTRFFLGRICRYGHDFAGTGQSLRRINHPSRPCLECTKASSAKSYAKHGKARWERQKARHQHHWNERLEARKQRRQRNLEKYLETDRKWRQANAEELRKKDRDRYRNNPDKRSKTLVRVQQWAQANPERKRANALKYVKSEKGKLNARLSQAKRRISKARNHSLHYSRLELKQHLTLFDGKCVYCQKPFYQHLDHFIPIKRGGGDLLSNLVPACSRCNLSKGDRDPKGWFQSQTFYSLKQWKFILRVLGKTDASYDQLPLI